MLIEITDNNGNQAFINLNKITLIVKFFGDWRVSFGKDSIVVTQEELDSILQIVKVGKS